MKMEIFSYHYVHQDLICIFIFPNEDLIYQIWVFNKQKIYPNEPTFPALS